MEGLGSSSLVAQMTDPFRRGSGNHVALPAIEAEQCDGLLVRVRFASVVATGVVAAVAALALVGWTADIAVLKSIVSGWHAINPMTAVLFLATSAARRSPQMPIMEGCEATLQLRNRGYDKPIIALTANADGTSRQKCMRAGCNAFLTKPIDPSELIATVRRWTTKPATSTQAA